MMQGVRVVPPPPGVVPPPAAPRPAPYPQAGEEQSASWYPANPYFQQATRDAEMRSDVPSGHPVSRAVRAPPPPGNVAVPPPVPVVPVPVPPPDKQAWEEMPDGQAEPSKPALPPVNDEAREEEDAKKVAAIAPALDEKMAAAEDEMEKVAILAEPVLMDASEDLRSMQMHAISEVEREVKVASGVLSLAKMEYQRRSREAEGLAPRAKAAAEEVLAKYAARLESATSILSEHKNIRADHELALKAESEFGDLAGRLAAVEVECEKATAATEPLLVVLESNPEDLKSAAVEAAEEALKAAESLFVPSGQLLASRLHGLKGTARVKLLELQARTELSRKVLDKITRTVEECRARLVAGPLLKEAMDRVASVPETLQALLESEKPFLTGDERMPADEAEALLRDMDLACVSAEAKLKDVQSFVLEKVAEAEKLTSEGAIKPLVAELDKSKKQIADGLRSIHRFQGATAKRRRACFIVAIRQKVEEAETVMARVKDAAAELQEAAGRGDSVDKAKRIDAEALVAVRAARQEYEERLKVLGPSDDDQAAHVPPNNSEVARTKSRVESLEDELAKFHKTVCEFEERLDVEKSMADINSSIAAAEEGTERLLTLSTDWPRDRKPPADDEKNLFTLQSRLKATLTRITSKLHAAHGLEHRELQVALSRLQRTRAKLDRVQAVASELRQSLLNEIMNEVADTVEQAEEKISSVSSAASSVAKIPAEELEPLYKRAVDAVEPVIEAQKELTCVKAPSLTTKVGIEFSRLQALCRSLSQQGKAIANSLHERLRGMQAESVQLALDSLADMVSRAGKASNLAEIFVEMANGQEIIGRDRIRELLSSGTPSLNDDQVHLAFDKLCPHGMSRLLLATMLGSYRKVVRDISLTTDFEVKSERIRKLSQGELLEVLGEPKEDTGLSLERLQCRAVQDGTSGWVTIKSNAGAAYLEATDKPYLWCSLDTALHPDASLTGVPVRTLQAGEVVELLEGPTDGPAAALRVQGARRDGKAAGWLQVREDHKSLVEPSAEFFRCNDAVAMTDVSDVDQCRMLRRVDGGEVLEVLPEAEVISSKGGRRRKFKACSDGMEGWVTTQGNQGTSYLSLDPRHLVCKNGATVYADLAADAAVLEVLPPGSVFVASDEPKELPGEKMRLYRIRTTTDFTEAFISQGKEETLQVWRRRYEVAKATPLLKEADSQEEQRALEPNELVDLLEYPSSKGDRLVVRCVAVKDSVVGWAVVTERVDNTPTPLLRPAPLSAAGPGEEDEVEAEFLFDEPHPGKGYGKGGKGGKSKYKSKGKDGHYSAGSGAVGAGGGGRPPPRSMPSSGPPEHMPPPPPPAPVLPVGAGDQKGAFTPSHWSRDKGPPKGKGKGKGKCKGGFDPRGREPPRGKGYDGKGYDGKGYDSKGYDGKGYDGKGKDPQSWRPREEMHGGGPPPHIG